MRWLLVMAVAIGGCKHESGPVMASDKEQLIAATRHYDELVRAMNSTAIAQLFTPDGTIENAGKVIAVGPVAIRELLGALDGKVKVESTNTTVETVHVDADRATVDGHYEQTARELATNHVTSVAGSYQAEWLRDGTAWRIHHMRTSPSTK